VVTIWIGGAKATSIEIADRTILNVAAGRDHTPHVEVAMPASPMVEITYCRLCGWGLRASWMAQELLTTFAEELGSITLTPDITGGIFEVRVDSEVIWSRKERGRLVRAFEVLAD
jgi:selenoprotein W-related protein